MEKVSSSGFIERNIPKKKKRKLSRLGKLTFLLAFLVVFTICCLVLTSKIKSVKVIGNELVSDKYILNALSIKEDEPLYSCYNFIKIAKVKKDDLIEDIDVKVKKDRTVVITIKENRIIGQREKNGNIQLILSTGKVIDYKEESLNNLVLLPSFIDIDDEKTIKIAEKLALIDNDNLFRISEVHDLSFTYDYDMVKLVMDEGNYIYSSLEGLTYVKNYLQIITNDQNESNKCILIMEQYNKALKTDCSQLEKYQVEQNKED